MPVGDEIADSLVTTLSTNTSLFMSILCIVGQYKRHFCRYIFELDQQYFIKNVVILDVRIISDMLNVRKNLDTLDVRKNLDTLDS